jgi:hypothetical protein
MKMEVQMEGTPKTLHKRDRPRLAYVRSVAWHTYLDVAR